MLDLDVILRKDLFEWINITKALPIVAGGGNSVNGGTIFADRTAIPLLSEWGNATIGRYVDEKFFEQAALEAVRKKSGGIQLIPFEDVGQCGRKGVFATHYNCVGNKVESMSENHEWLIGNTSLYGEQWSRHEWLAVPHLHREDRSA